MITNLLPELKLRMTKATFIQNLYRIEKQAHQNVIKSQNKQFASRLEGLEHSKRLEKEKDATEKLHGVKVTDNEIDEEVIKLNLEKVPNYIVLGEIELSVNERKFLDVHSKCRENRKQSNVDIEIKITKMGIKHRYKKMSQGDELEYLPKPERIEELKKLERQKQIEVNREILEDNDVNFTKVRPTDLTFNTRILPPSEATRKSEAAIVNQESLVRDCIREHARENPYSSVLSEDENKGKDSLYNSGYQASTSQFCLEDP